MNGGTDFNKRLVPICIIYMDGERLSPRFEGAFQSVKAFDRLNAVGVCKIKFNYNELESKDTKDFPPGTQFSLNLGYKDDTKEVFKGEVTAKEIELSERKAIFTLTASSYLQRLGHGTHTRRFENKTPSQAIKWLLEHYDLKVECEGFGREKPYWGVGTDITDLDLLFTLTKKYGKDVCCVGDKIYVKDLMTHRKDELIYEWGKSLISFEIIEDRTKQVSGMQIFGWDVMKAEDFKGGAKISDINQKIGGNKDWEQISRRKDADKRVEYRYMDDVADPKEAEEVAQAFLKNRSMRFLRAEGKAEGNCRLASGAIVDVKYVGKRHSGEYIAETVVHDFSLEGGYVNEMYLKRNMFPSDYKAPGSGFVDKYADEAHQRRMAEQQAAAVAQTEDEDKTTEDEEDAPEFSNLVWKKDGEEVEEALIDDEVTLNFDVMNIDDGETVNVKIFEQSDNNDDAVDEINGKVEDGKVEISWKIIFKKENSNVTQELKEEKYTIPDYYYIAEYNGIESRESNVINIKDYLDSEVVFENTNEIVASRKYTIVLPDGRRIENTTDENGQIREKDLLIGEAYIFFNEEEDG